MESVHIKETNIKEIIEEGKELKKEVWEGIKMAWCNKFTCLPTKTNPMFLSRTHWLKNVFM